MRKSRKRVSRKRKSSSRKRVPLERRRVSRKRQSRHRTRRKSIKKHIRYRVGGGGGGGDRGGDLCPICLYPLDDMDSSKITCDHIYHTACINGWISRQRTCPKCRDPVSTIVPVRLNNANEYIESGDIQQVAPTQEEEDAVIRAQLQELRAQMRYLEQRLHRQQLLAELQRTNSNWTHEMFLDFYPFE